MEDPVARDIDSLIRAARSGDKEAAGLLVEALMDDLRRIAGSLMRREREDHTLQTTALVNEALMRLLGGDGLRHTSSRECFIGAAARAMRFVLVDHARMRKSKKRHGATGRVPLDAALAVFERQQLDVVAIHDALDVLAGLRPRSATIVELRIFGGRTIAEVAELLGVSVSTVEEDWRFARAWLRDKLKG